MANVVSMGVDWCVVLVYLLMEVEICFFVFYFLIGLTVHRNLISARGQLQTLWTARGKEGLGSAVILINPRSATPAFNTLSDSQRKKHDRLAPGGGRTGLGVPLVVIIPRSLCLPAAPSITTSLLRMHSIFPSLAHALPRNSDPIPRLRSYSIAHNTQEQRV